MQNLRKYFKNDESYSLFVNGLNDQFANITFGNRAKIEANKPPFLGASIPVKVKGQDGSKFGSYWFKIEKMSDITLD